MIDPAINAEWKKTQNGFVAGRKIADKFHWKKGDHIVLKGTYIPDEPRPRATSASFNAGDETNIFFHNEYLNQSDWFGANKFTGIYYLKVDSGENVPRVAAAIDEMFENSDAPTKTLTEKQFQLSFMEMMGNVKLLINGISLIILFAVTLIVANTVAMSARERVTEIAVMRTLGFGRGHILGFILSESVLMSLIGGILGVLLAKLVFIPLLVAVGNKTSVSIWLVNFKVTPETWLLAFAVSVGVGICAGFLPAIQSSRLNIVDGLRRVV